MRHHVDYCAHLVEDKSPNLATEKKYKTKPFANGFFDIRAAYSYPPPPPFDD